MIRTPSRWLLLRWLPLHWLLMHWLLIIAAWVGAGSELGGGGYWAGQVPDGVHPSGRHHLAPWVANHPGKTATGAIGGRIPPGAGFHAGG